MLALAAVSGFFRGEGGGTYFSAEKKTTRRRRRRGSHVNSFVPGDIVFESLGPSPVPVISPGNATSRVSKFSQKMDESSHDDSLVPTRVSPKDKKNENHSQSQGPGPRRLHRPRTGLKACAGPANKKFCYATQVYCCPHATASGSIAIHDTSIHHHRHRHHLAIYKCEKRVSKSVQRIWLMNQLNKNYLGMYVCMYVCSVNRKAPKQAELINQLN